MKRIPAVLLLLLGLSLGRAGEPQKPKPLPGSEECAGCHEAGRRTGKREAGVPPAFDEAALRASPHAALLCVNCHADLEGKPLPHPEKLARVVCGNCHPDEQAQHDESLHGKAVKRKDPMAPGCATCHGTHDIKRANAPQSRTSTMEIPKLCGNCHREGSPVSRTHNIPQDNILGNYLDSIHGEGLFRRGLTVTAVCTSCHSAHFVLPHTDPRSSISKQNVVKTCTKCHARIETVHQKVIRGELWEKKPHMIPVCVDCHEPHKIRRVFYAQGMSDHDCLRCHGNPDLKAVRGSRTVSMYVKQDQLAGSRHSKTACVQCHTGATPGPDRPCRTMTAAVDCSICHAAVVTQYRESRR
ncbi:MAG: cytochrome c3 family protein, partial [Acidobacteria bacterium]|nr:cytochrome c3 family protein [Acidobacteriota bacterium]